MTGRVAVETALAKRGAEVKPGLEVVVASAVQETLNFSVRRAYIVDLVFDKPIEDAPAAAAQLKNTCGVVDHGFFIGMTTAVIIAGEAGISVKTP